MLCFLRCSETLILHSEISLIEHFSNRIGGGGVAQWLERVTDDRVVAGSFPLAPLVNFGNFLYPTLPVSFGRD